MNKDKVVEILHLSFGNGDESIRNSDIIRRTFSNDQLSKRFDKAAELIMKYVEVEKLSSEIDIIKTIK